MPRDSRPGLLQVAPPAVLATLAGILLLTPLSVRILHDQWDKSFLRSPSCRMVSSANLQNLPKLVIFLGSEGSAHDLFEFIFSALPTQLSIERFDPSLHLTSADTQLTPPADKLRHSFCPKLPYARRLHDFGVEISGKLKEKAPSGGMTYVRARDPMPMGRIRTPLARLDPVSLATFHGLYYNLKVLILVRNFTKTAMWSISRNFHNDDVGLQLRLIEDSLVFMEASLRTLPCASYAIVNVDKLQDNRAMVAGDLSVFLDLPGITSSEMDVAIQVAFSRWEDYAPGKKGVQGEHIEPTFAGQKIDHFFGQRSGLWPLLDAASSYPIFVPRSPMHWPRG